MGVEYIYLSKTPIDVAQARQCSDRLREHFPRFYGFDTSEEQFAELKVKETWPELSCVPGFRLVTLDIDAKAPGSFGSSESVLQALQLAASSLPEKADFSVRCKFEEAGSLQKSAHYDWVKIQVARSEAPVFGYTAYGSRFVSDAALRREFFQRVITECELPLIIADTARGFQLAHTVDPKLGWADAEVNAKHFHCSLPGETPEGLMKRFDRFLLISANPEKRQWEWGVDSDEWPEHPDLGTSAYDWAVHSGLPITSADIVFSYVLEAVEAVDGLKFFAGRKGFDTQLCQVVLSEDTWADFKIRTTREEHRLLVELHDPEPRRPIQQFKQVLGLELERKAS